MKFRDWIKDPAQPMPYWLFVLVCSLIVLALIVVHLKNNP